jgi:hypothetical protein
MDVHTHTPVQSKQFWSDVRGLRRLKGMRPDPGGIFGARALEWSGAGTVNGDERSINTFNSPYSEFQGRKYKDRRRMLQRPEAGASKVAQSIDVAFK